MAEKLEAPWITHPERFGAEPGEQTPICPVCGEDCDLVYKDRDGNIFGCGNCVSKVDAYDEEQCFPEDY